MLTRDSDLQTDSGNQVPADSTNQVKGESFSFPKILDLYEGPLLRYASRILAYAKCQPEDIVQDAFMKLHQNVKADGWESIVDIKNWLFRVTHNLCMDVMRREKTEKKYVNEQQVENNDLLIIMPEASEKEIIKEEYRMALQVLETLDENEKQVLTLKLLEGLKNIEIASILGAQESNVSYWLHKGLKNLAFRLKEKELL